MTNLVGKGEVALIVLSYLKEEKFESTFQAFSTECKSLLEQSGLQGVVSSVFNFVCVTQFQMKTYSNHSILLNCTQKSSMKNLQLILSEYVGMLQERQAKDNLAKSLCKNETNRRFVEQTIHSISNLLEMYSSLEMSGGNVSLPATAVSSTVTTSTAPTIAPKPKTSVYVKKSSSHKSNNTNSMVSNSTKLQKNLATNNNSGTTAQQSSTTSKTKTSNGSPSDLVGSVGTPLMSSTVASGSTNNAATNSSMLNTAAMSWSNFGFPLFPINFDQSSMAIPLTGVIPQQQQIPLPDNALSLGHITANMSGNTKSAKESGVASGSGNNSSVSTSSNNNLEQSVTDKNFSQDNNQNSLKRKIAAVKCQPEAETTSQKSAFFNFDSKVNGNANNLESNASKSSADHDEPKTPQSNSSSKIRSPACTFTGNFFSPPAWNQGISFNTPMKLPDISLIETEDTRDKKRRRTNGDIKDEDNFEFDMDCVDRSMSASQQSTGGDTTINHSEERKSDALRRTSKDLEKSGLFNESSPSSQKSSVTVPCLRSEGDVDAFLSRLTYQ